MDITSSLMCREVVFTKKGHNIVMELVKGRHLNSISQSAVFMQKDYDMFAFAIASDSENY